MKPKHAYPSLWLLLITLQLNTSYAQSTDTLQLSQWVLKGARVETYKRVGTTELRMSFIYPPDRNPGQTHPAIVFFFGGGWQKGDVQQFEQHCHYLAARGMVAIAADYRVSTRQGTTPVEAVQDAKSAMRWLRNHAAELGILPDQIVAAGGSAGGHLALAVAMLPGLNEPGEDTTVSTRPSALALFNPVVRTLPGGYGYERLLTRAEALSPDAHIRAGLPPMIIFHGTADTTMPFEYVDAFAKKMEAAGNTCQLQRFPGQQHGFFNYNAKNPTMYNETIALTDQFLSRLGYLKPTDKMSLKNH